MTVSYVERSDADTQTLAVTITVYVAISKFGDALGVALEDVFSGAQPLMHVNH